MHTKRRIDDDVMIDIKECARQLGLLTPRGKPDPRQVYYHAEQVRKDPKHVAFPYPVKVGRRIRFLQSDVTKFKHRQLVAGQRRCKSCGQLVPVINKAEARANGPQQVASAKKPTAKKIANPSGRVNGNHVVGA